MKIYPVLMVASAWIAGCAAQEGSEPAATSNAAISENDVNVECANYRGLAAGGGCRHVNGHDIPAQIFAAFPQYGGFASIGLPIGDLTTCETPPGVPVPEVPCQRFERATIEQHGYDTQQPYKIGLIGRGWLESGALLAATELLVGGTPADLALYRKLRGPGGTLCSSSGGASVEDIAGISYANAARPESTSETIRNWVAAHGGIARWGIPITPVIINSGERGDVGSAETNTRIVIEAIATYAVPAVAPGASVHADVGGGRLDGAVRNRNGRFDVVSQFQIFERGRIEVHLGYASAADAVSEGPPAVPPVLTVEAGLVGSEVLQMDQSGPDRCQR